MMALYTSTKLVKDQIATLFCSIVLTVFTVVVVALVIGFIQMLTLILKVAQPSGKFWVSLIKIGECAANASEGFVGWDRYCGR